MQRGETRDDRVAGRALLGPLAGLLIAPRMRVQYATAVWYFVRCMVSLFGFVSEDFPELDRQLQYFLCLLWAEGESKSFAAHTVCGLQHFLNVRRTFPGSWRLYAAWDRAEVPCRAPPLPRDVVFGIAGWLVARGEVGAACLVLIGFNCFLRTGELLTLRRSHVRWSPSGDSGVLLLPWTKSGERTGAPETVSFSDALVCHYLRRACALVPPEARLFLGSGSQFRSLFDAALDALQVNHVGFRPYSLRRGGATADFLEHGSAATTQLRGRWGSLRVCRIYVTEGQEALARFLVPPAAQALIQHFARYLL